jgi:hypothetical protein
MDATRHHSVTASIAHGISSDKPKIMAQKRPNIMKTKRAVADACRMDDVPLMTELVSEATEHRLVVTTQQLLDIGLDRSVGSNATKVLTYVLEQGADLEGQGVYLTLPWADHSLPSRATLDILIAHGWNIDSCGHTSADTPLLWKVLGHPELVDWFLSHGASVHLSTPANHQLRPILERAAAGGNVALFARL